MSPKKRAKLDDATEEEGKLTVGSIKKMTVVQLKAECSNRGLSDDGTKAILVARLVEVVKGEPVANAAAETTAAAPDVAEEEEAAEEPPEKKQKLEEAVAEEMDVDAGTAVAPEKPKEEEDAAADARPKLTKPVEFLVPDTTLNVMPATFGGMLMTLSEGGLQYLYAGARASVGVKSGRYMFEVRLMENLNPVEPPNTRTAPAPKNVCRVGFSVAGGLPLIGDTEESVCFDIEGCFLSNKKKTTVSKEKFTSKNTLAVVLNLEKEGPFANTISLFSDGVRVSTPQALPVALRGKVLYPTVTFKNVTVHVNFGPSPHTPLPFKCRTVQDAAKDDAVETNYKTPADGMYECLVPICMPDEGAFDWVDWFVGQNPEYCELSDRKIIEWTMRSGIARHPRAQFKHSNDKPDYNFQIGTMDDGSVKQLVYIVGPVQSRNFIVMEVKGNLMKEDRQDVLKRFRLPHIKRVATVLMGEPSKDFQLALTEEKLKAKQSKLTAEFEAQKAEKVRKKAAEARNKLIEKTRKRAELLKKKAVEVLRRKAVAAAAAEAGEEVPEEPEETNEPEEEMSAAEEPEVEETPPVAVLTDAEKRERFKKSGVPDITPPTLSAAFAKFSLPEDGDGFDEVRYGWLDREGCAAHMKSWMMERKMTTKVEDLNPSDWFKKKWQEWQKDLQVWHQKHKDNKDPAKKAAAMARRQAALAKQPKEEEKAENAEAEKENDKANENAAEEKVEKDPMILLEEEMDRQDLDVFSVDDVCDMGNGEPLFTSFAFEDWALLSLRFETHLLVHAFRRDCNDPDRIGIAAEHITFYYNKYFKKQLNPKNYGVETIELLIELIEDTVISGEMSKIVESQIADELESNEVFVKLTEEARRERQRRIDTGDHAADLKFSVKPTEQQAMLGAYAGDRGVTTKAPSPAGARVRIGGPAPQQPGPQFQQATAKFGAQFAQQAAQWGFPFPTTPQAAARAVSQLSAAMQARRQMAMAKTSGGGGGGGGFPAVPRPKIGGKIGGKGAGASAGWAGWGW